MNERLAKLPPKADLESTKVLRKVSSANRFLAELKGVTALMPNQDILINTLSLQEAKDSSAIENIITTNDELFRADLHTGLHLNPAAKEVRNYTSALKIGVDLLKKDGVLINKHILLIQEIIESNRAGFRRLPGTVLKNESTGEVVYTPPQNYLDIVSLMDNLEKYINDDSLSDIDHLIKMAIIHYQFESIHPFYDGNGRTGRIINILYLILKGLLDIPVLYLSRYIVRTKDSYYRLLQDVRDNNNWEEWIIYMLEGVENTAKQTLLMINEIRRVLDDYQSSIRQKHKFYSKDLINNLFFNPYTKIEYLMRDINVSRMTATKYLDILCEDGLLTKRKMGRTNYYINNELLRILAKWS